MLTRLCCSLADCNGCELEKAPNAGNAVLATAGWCWKSWLPWNAWHYSAPQKWRQLNTHLGAGRWRFCSCSWAQGCAGAVGAVPVLCPASPELSGSLCFSFLHLPIWNKENLHLAVLSESVGDLQYLLFLWLLSKL